MTESDQYFFEYLDFLEKKVVEILIHDKMFREVTEMIKTNPTIYQGNSFYSWMASRCSPRIIYLYVRIKVKVQSSISIWIKKMV